MVMQRPHYTQQKKQSSSKIAPLRMVEHPNAFGAHLEYIRNRMPLARQVVADALPEYFEEYNVTFPTSDPRDMYRKTEKGIRAIQFEELIPLYAALIGCGIRQSIEERHTFVRLARLKLESLQRKRPRLRPDSEWDWLEAQLAKIDQQKPKSSAQSAFDAALSENVFDISHVVGRDEWLQTVLSYLHTTPPKKLVVIQGMMGMGKTTCLKLLLHTLSEQDGYQPILHLFSDQQDMTSEDHLDTFLATALAKREVIIPETKMPNRHEQIKLLLWDLCKAEQRVVLLLDDAQVILDEHGQLPAAWQDFFTEFLQRSHQAATYLATREWSMWPGRDPVYVVDGDKALLPRMSPEAGAQIWRRFGFDDVDEELLRRAVERFGGNPRMIELRATTTQRHKLSFSWERSETQLPALTSRSEKKSEHQELIEQLLKDSQIFGIADIEVHQLLRQVVSQRVSHDALPILEILAISPLALPFPLLYGITPQAEYALVELLNASLLDQTVIVNKRAGVQPLTREAVVHTFFFKEGRAQEIEHLLVDLYQQWLTFGTFRSENEREKGDVVAELAVLLLKHQRMLRAAELLIRFGWLAFNQGHTIRLARLAKQTIQDKSYEPTAENECGQILLHYHLSSFLGNKVHSKQRAVDYRRIHDFIFAGNVKLEPQIEVHIMHHLMLAAMNELHFSEAKMLLDAYCTRFETLKQHDRDLQEALLEKRAWLFGKWGVDLEEQQRFQEARELQEQSIALYKECVGLLSRERKLSSLEETSVKKRLGVILNGIAYRLNKLGDYEEARKYVEQSIELKEQGYVDVGALAASQGEKSQILANLGQFREALVEDEKAFAEVQRLAHEGHSPSQEEIWIYHVNRGRLFLLLGRVDEAYQLLKDTPDNIHERRRVFKMLAKDLLDEISAWRCVNPGPPYQLDWRWTQRYRDLISYDPYWWWALAGPFNDEEKSRWDQLFTTGPIDKQTRKHLNALIAESRQREITIATAEQREPHLWYPAINVDEVRERIVALHQLDNEILSREPNALVRRLYHDAIEGEVQYLQMIEATSQRDSTKFWKLSRSLYPPTTAEEMQYPLRQVKHTLWQGLQCQETKHISQQLLDLIKEQLHLTFDFSNGKDIAKIPALGPSAPNEEKIVTAGTAQRFFEWALHESGYEGWQVVVDPKASGASVYSAQRQFVLQDSDIPLSQVKHYLSHELAGHVARTVAGERSPLGILATGTKNYIPTEEGLALYNEKQTALLCGGTFDDSGSWLGMLAVGLATGVVTPPQTFSRLYAFFESFLLIRRLLRKQDRDRETATKQAQKKALDRCIRTYRGVPNFEQVGICFSKDVVYMRGLYMIEVAVGENPAILDRLAVGKIAKEYADILQELELVPPPSTLRELVHDPDLDTRILSFEQI